MTHERRFPLVHARARQARASPHQHQTHTQLPARPRAAHTRRSQAVHSQGQDLALGQGAAAFLHGGVTQLTGVAAPGLLVVLPIHQPPSVPQV